MKKVIMLLLICVSLFFASCSNAFAKAEYDTADKIVGSGCENLDVKILSSAF